MVDHCSYIHNLSIVKLKPEQNSGMNRIQTHDPSDTSAVLYQLSYQANRELVTLCVHNILSLVHYVPIDGEE